MPSIKKRVSGFIRQISTGGNVRGGYDSRNSQEDRNRLGGRGLYDGSVSSPDGRRCFIKKYLDGDVQSNSSDEGICIPEVFSSKTGHDLPIVRLGLLDPDVFAAFTGPEGGITSIQEEKTTPKEQYLGGDKFSSDSELSDELDFVEDQRVKWDEFKSRYKSSQRKEKNLEFQSLKPAATSLFEERAHKHTSSVEETSQSLSSLGDYKHKHVRSVSTSSVEFDYPELASSCRRASSISCCDKENEIAARLKRDLRGDDTMNIAGIRNWHRSHIGATGRSVSLYERHPYTNEFAGSPVADTFAIVARNNSAILALADGVNWGAKAALASRCAVYACVDYLNSSLFKSDLSISQTVYLTTQDVFQSLLRSFHAAHSLIIQEDGQLTTLTACLVLPVSPSERGPADSQSYIVCVCNVGDSLAYVFSPKSGRVRELTLASHDIQANRDMRDALGALGPVDGLNPVLSNLTCSMSYVEPGDIVFLTSDGISDNFDPVVGKFCVSKKPQGHVRSGSTSSLPSVAAFQRHELSLLRMEDLLNHGSESEAHVLYYNNNGMAGRVQSASELCYRLVDFSQRLTNAKRKILEDPELYQYSGREGRASAEKLRMEQKQRRRRVADKLVLVPGKLDHASVVAFCVEDKSNLFNFYQNESRASRCSPLLAEITLLRAPCASIEDLSLRGSPDEDDEPTPTVSLNTSSQSNSSCSSSPSNAGSLAATPTHSPKRRIIL